MTDIYCLGLYGGGDYYVIPEEGLRNNLLCHSGPLFSLANYKEKVENRALAKLGQENSGPLWRRRLLRNPSSGIT